MTKIYKTDVLEECPDCGGKLVLIMYRGGGFACENCTPDGLLKQYRVKG